MTLPGLDTPTPRTRRTHPTPHLNTTTSRGTHTTWCHCGTPTLRGLDEDVCATTATTDTTPLTPLGEALAWLNGQRTYELRTINGTPQLMRRTRWTITSHPPGATLWCGPIDVLPQHQCGAPPLPTQPTVHPPRTPRKATSDQHIPY